MKKIKLIAILVLSLLLALIGTLPAQASNGISITENQAAVNFPASLTFRLKATSSVNITEVRLHYTVDQASFAEVISEVFLPITPAPQVSPEWTWDMRMTGGFPTGTVVNYWWTVRDAGGGQQETLPARMNFTDSRYTWRNLSENQLTLYWYEGSDAFARDLMTAAQQALTQLAQDTGARLEEAVSIYIYGSNSDLQGAMIFPQEWTGGVAYTRFGTIVIGIAPTDLAWGKRAIAHELAHMVSNQLTFNPYGGLPVWLEEGLAMYAEGELNEPFRSTLEAAIKNNRLISVRSLASPFSSDPEQAYLSYAESFSLADYLINHYGQSKMLALLQVFRQGAGYDEALQEAYGFDMDGLNREWQTALTGAAVAA